MLPQSLEMMTSRISDSEQDELGKLSEGMSMVELTPHGLALHFAVGVLMYVNSGGRVIFQDPKAVRDEPQRG